MASNNLVILGGSYAGINTAHYIMQHVLPALPSSNYRVVLVNPSKDFFHRIAAPRALVSASFLAEHNVFMNIAAGFEQYGPDTFTFIQGKAVRVESNTQKVIVEGSEGKQQTVPYHALIVATGTKSLDALLSTEDTDGEATRQAMTLVKSQLESARSVVVAGGGPSGVEVAGEIAEYYNGRPGWIWTPEQKMQIHLVTSGERLIPALQPRFGKKAEKMLAEMGVETIYNTKITGADKLPTGKTKVHLGDGRDIEADVYINAAGVKPMTDFLPRAWVNDNGKVKSNSSTLRVDAAGPRVYAIGDVGAHSRGGGRDLINSVPVLATNLKTDILAAAGTKPQFADRVFHGDTAETLAVTIGQSRGVGAVNGWRIPSFLLWFVKGRDYFSSRVKVQLEGKHFTKEVPYVPVPL